MGWGKDWLHTVRLYNKDRDVEDALGKSRQLDSSLRRDDRVSLRHHHSTPSNHREGRGYHLQKSERGREQGDDANLEGGVE